MSVGNRHPSTCPDGGRDIGVDAPKWNVGNPETIHEHPGGSCSVPACFDSHSSWREDLNFGGSPLALRDNLGVCDNLTMLGMTRTS